MVALFFLDLITSFFGVGRLYYAGSPNSSSNVSPAASLKLRSRCRHKAWGVSPRINRDDICQPVERAIAFQRFSMNRDLSSRALSPNFAASVLSPFPLSPWLFALRPPPFALGSMRLALPLPLALGPFPLALRPLPFALRSARHEKS